MLKSRVTCHFCNKETFVFIVYKNSWECQECKQYNGFTKDGDYNKQIPEMQKESKKTFCLNSTPATPKQSAESTNLLCSRCNSSQEQKLKELNNFEAKNENNFDEEYKIFKSKLDHIYDLCRGCKIKLNMHLQRQDHQIGNYNEKGLKSTGNLTPLKSSIKQSKTGLDSDKNFQIKKRQISITKAAEIKPDVVTPYKKAYTVSGSSPYSHERQNLTKASPRKSEYIYDAGMEPLKSNDQDYTSKVDKLISTNLIKSKHSISWFVIQTVLVDILTFLGVIIIFACDVANLINDSGIWQENNFNGVEFTQNNDQHYLFKAFLRVYKYSQFLLLLILTISICFALRRPKMSRFLICLGIFFNFLIHVNFFGTPSDEKYILEVFVSFFLSSYLSLARVYNVLQCYRYITNAS